MPVATYETLFLLDSTKVSTDADGSKNQLHTLLERHGGQVILSRPWDYNHKLTYPISKQKKGAFHIIYYTMDSLKQTELERDLQLADALVLRQLTLKIDPKWQEAILAVARDDGGNGFALRGMHDEATVTTNDPMMMGIEGGPGMGMDGEGMGGGGGPRRGRRFEGGGDRPE